MKRLCLILVLLWSLNLAAQQSYTVDGQSLTLKTEVEGTITLLWNTIDGEYRYFLKKGNTISELTNTRTDGSYQNEFREVLRNQTSDQAMNSANVDLTLASLSDFFIDYNSKADPNYDSGRSPVVLSTRLALFAGATNYVYFVNPDNSLLPQAGIDFELIDESKLKRHGIVFQLRQLFSTSDFDLSSTQISLNYRFKFVQCDAVDVFINTKIAGYSHLSQNIPDPDGDGNTNDAITGSGGEFQAPFALGLGADIPLGNGFITLGWYDVVALNLEDNGDFSTDIVVGYKFNL